MEKRSLWERLNFSTSKIDERAEQVIENAHSLHYYCDIYHYCKDRGILASEEELDAAVNCMESYGLNSTPFFFWVD